jgi:hypothetical protein
LKLSAAGLTATGLTATATADLASVLAPAPQGDIAVRVTGGKLRYAAVDNLAWKTANTAARNAIVLNPGH